MTSKSDDTSEKITQDNITAEQFARWSFETDRSKRLYTRTTTFDMLPADERDVYMEEAKYYVNAHPRDD